MIRKLAALTAGTAILLSAGCGSQSSKDVSASLGANALPSIKPPAYVPGPFDGESTPRALAMRRPLAVIVENYAPDSRPQTGLGSASTVIEALAEAGITRFMAIYLEHDAAKVGPVRSTRVYFNTWAAGFHTILAHVGGNDDAQAELWHIPKIFNVDENRWEVNLYDTGTPLFWRSADRQPPHNMYTSTYKIRSYADRNKQNWAYTGAYLLHKHPLAASKRGHVGTISIGFEDPLNPQPNGDYDVRYVYKRASNTYLRYMGGTPHVDAATGHALKPANLIVMQVANPTPDPFAGTTLESIRFPVTGRGTAFYFHDGKVQRGFWRQPNQFAPLRFYDQKGHEAAFNPGQTWIDVVPPSSPWSYR